MISKEIILKIIEAGCQAPSGGNSQPWEFSTNKNTIDIFATPEKDHPILNVENRGTWIAHGALIENISIAASKFGINAEIEIFPDSNKKYLTARIKLDETNSGSPADLYRAIYSRTTNRKHYLKEQVPPEIYRDLIESSVTNSPVSAKFLNDQNVIKKIAKELSVSDRIMFQNKILHKLFFKEVVWNRKEEKLRGSGLLIDTLELKTPQRVMLHFLKYWPLMHILSKLGIAKLIAKDNEQTHSSCSLVCAVQLPNTEKSFIEAGRLIQRIWLTSTKLGLSVQINTGLFFFWQGIDLKTVTIFSPREEMAIINAYTTVANICNTDNGNIVTAIMRIGFDGQPSARSLKKEAKIIT